jgi:endonuclease/exonuclease/phosphatase family metal-dependent hydrolase
MTALIVAVLLLGAACSSESSAPPPDAGPSSSAEATEPPTVTMISFNLLHGIPEPIGDCAAETDYCQAPDRLTLLWDQIEAAGCPALVSLQEIYLRQKELIPERIGSLCDGQYDIVFEDRDLFDQQLLLTTLAVTDSQVVELGGDFRTATLVGLDAPVGPLRLLSTHIDDDEVACTSTICPSTMCDTTMGVGSCEVRQILAMLEDDAQARGDPTFTILNGDLNQAPGSAGLDLLTGAGFVDAWSAAGNPECDPATGTGCTCCVTGDGPLAGLDQPVAHRTERIDWILVAPPPDCDVFFDGPSDTNGNGTATAVFAAEPAEAPVHGIFWSSDHAGVQAELGCR